MKLVEDFSINVPGFKVYACRWEKYQSEEPCDLAIIIGNSNTTSYEMEEAVFNVVRGRSYNEFVKKNVLPNDNSIRIILFGVNEIKYKKNKKGLFKDVWYYCEPLPSDIFPKTYIALFLGGLGKPESYLDDIVSKYVSGSEQYMEYTEVFRDNPYMRMIINKVNNKS